MPKKIKEPVVANQNHLHWSVEVGDGLCPVCKNKTVLARALSTWEIDEEDIEKNTIGQMDGSIDVHDEVTGHFCLKCCRLRALSLNTHQERK